MGLPEQLGAMADVVVAERVARMNLSSLGRHLDAENMARGIDQSKLVGEISNGVRELRDSTVSLALLTDIHLSSITAEMSRSANHLAGIEEVLRNPTGTAAREHLNRGIKAMQHGWLPEAETEFRAALALDPYLAATHLLFAIDLLQQDATRHVEVIESLRCAYRYATPDDPSVATAAALISARVHADAANSGAEQEIARAAAEQYPECPDLALLNATLSNNTHELERALSYAPELAVSAMLVAPELFALTAREGTQLASHATHFAEVILVVNAELGSGSLVDVDLSLSQDLIDEDEPISKLSLACKLLQRSRHITTALENRARQLDSADRAAVDAVAAERRQRDQEFASLRRSKMAIESKLDIPRDLVRRFDSLTKDLRRAELEAREAREGPTVDGRTMTNGQSVEAWVDAKSAQIGEILGGIPSLAQVGHQVRPASNEADAQELGESHQKERRRWGRPAQKRLSAGERQAQDRERQAQEWARERERQEQERARQIDRRHHEIQERWRESELAAQRQLEQRRKDTVVLREKAVEQLRGELAIVQEQLNNEKQRAWARREKQLDPLRSQISRLKALHIAEPTGLREAERAKVLSALREAASRYPISGRVSPFKVPR